MRNAVCLTCALLFACDPAPREVTAPAADAPAVTNEATSATPATTATTAATATTATATPPTTTTITAGRFPALDDSCTSDADCVLFEDEIADAPPRTYTCCGGCLQRAANKSWLAQFRALCSGLSPPSCPPLGCAMPILRPACQAGHCVALK